MNIIPLANDCFASTYKYTWRDKIRNKLFPTEICDLPIAPATHKDVLVCKVGVELSFIGRLQVLFSGKLLVESKTVTENIVGNCITSSVAYPIAPDFLYTKQ